MPAASAGFLMFRRRDAVLQVLLVHPGGPFWANRDEHAWSIPKGEIAPGEEPLQAAVREFHEETGLRPAGAFHPLTPVRQRNGKVVHAWAFESDWDPERLHSNTFAIEWPPGSGEKCEFPEVDRAAWFSANEAKRRLIAGQVPLVSELERLLRLG